MIVSFDLPNKNYSFVNLFNEQTESMYNEVLIKSNGKTYQIHPLAYLWLKEQDKLVYIEKVMRLFDNVFLTILETNPIDKLEKLEMNKYKYIFSAYTLTESNIPYLYSFALLIEHLYDERFNFSIEEKLNYAIDYNRKEDKHYMSELNKIIELYKRTQI